MLHRVVVPQHQREEIVAEHGIQLKLRILRPELLRLRLPLLVLLLGEPLPLLILLRVDQALVRRLQPLELLVLIHAHTGGVGGVLPIGGVALNGAHELCHVAIRNAVPLRQQVDDRLLRLNLAVDLAEPAVDQLLRRRGVLVLELALDKLRELLALVYGCRILCLGLRCRRLFRLLAIPHFRRSGCFRCRRGACLSRRGAFAALAEHGKVNRQQMNVVSEHITSFMRGVFHLP